MKAKKKKKKKKPLEAHEQSRRPFKFGGSGEAEGMKRRGQTSEFQSWLAIQFVKTLDAFSLSRFLRLWSREPDGAGVKLGEKMKS